jgi:hypothetical protein
MCAGKKQKKQKAREEEISGDDSVTEIGAKCRKELGLEEDDDEEKKSKKSGRKAKKRKEEEQLDASSSEEEERRRRKRQKKVKNFQFFPMLKFNNRKGESGIRNTDLGD